MTNQQSTPEAVVCVAIDIARDRHKVLIEAPEWKNRKKFRVQNAAEEFRAFADFLHSLDGKVRIGFEPTGNYHRALAYFLHSEGFYLPARLFPGPHEGCHAQLLGQERSQRRAGHFASVDEGSELPNHSGGARLLRSFGDRRTTFLV